jgi:hypothetical protein
MNELLRHHLAVICSYLVGSCWSLLTLLLLLLRQNQHAAAFLCICVAAGSCWSLLTLLLLRSRSG